MKLTDKNTGRTLLMFGAFVLVTLGAVLYNNNTGSYETVNTASPSMSSYTDGTFDDSIPADSIAPVEPAASDALDESDTSDNSDAQDTLEASAEVLEAGSDME